MRVLVTGAGGQLGSEIRFLANSFLELDFRFHTSKSLDITDNKQVQAEMADYKPDYVVNCAAYTAVDQAEDEPDKAIKVNSRGVSHLVSACIAQGAILIHISTDYVFDGTGSVPYGPEDGCLPIGSYGSSKRLGEIEILSKKIDAFILRTSWVYSSYGKNFVKTMLKLGKERSQLNVVADQFGSPTYAGDLAKAIVEIVNRDLKPVGPEIHHYCNQGICSWNEFAIEIMKVADLDCEIHPISTSEYPTKAARPGYSVLDTTSFKERFSGLQIPNWKDALERCHERMIQPSETSS